MNHRLLGFAMTMVVASVIVGGCGSNTEPADTSLKVRAITIGEEKGTDGAGYSGTIHNKTETNLAFQVGGRIINKFVDVGTPVTAGQVPRIVRATSGEQIAIGSNGKSIECSASPIATSTSQSQFEQQSK